MKYAHIIMYIKTVYPVEKKKQNTGIRVEKKTPKTQILHTAWFHFIKFQTAKTKATV